MKAILLCAGFATRLHPLTLDFPKPLLEVAGRPILEDLVEQLIATGHFDSFQVISNARFHQHFTGWAEEMAVRHPDVELAVVDDGALENETRLGAVGDLALALRSADPGELALVAAGDNLFRFDLHAFVAAARKSPHDRIAVYREKDPGRRRRTGIVEVDAEGRVVGFFEKSDDPPSDLASPAIYLLTRQALELVPAFLAECPDADAPGHFIAWLALRRPVFAHEMQGERLDVGNREDLENADAWLASRERPSHD